MMRQERGLGASDAASVIALLGYIQSEVRHLNPIAALFLSASMDVLKDGPPPFLTPRQNCPSPQGASGVGAAEARTEDRPAPRQARRRFLRLPRLADG
jgi:hypothetical protein